MNIIWVNGVRRKGILSRENINSTAEREKEGIQATVQFHYNKQFAKDLRLKTWIWARLMEAFKIYVTHFDFIRSHKKSIKIFEPENIKSNSGMNPRVDYRKMVVANKKVRPMLHLGQW